MEKRLTVEDYLGPPEATKPQDLVFAPIYSSVVTGFRLAARSFLRS